MSHADHEWAKEHLPAHLAGGLSAEERARLEAHISECAECIAEIDALRRFERGMDDLFAPVRPQPGIEERVIRAVRAAPGRMAMPPGSRVWLGIAAVVLLGVLGFAIFSMEGGMGSAKIGMEVAASPPRMPPSPAAVPPPDLKIDGAYSTRHDARLWDEGKRLAGADEAARERARELLRDFDRSRQEIEGADSEEFRKAKDDSAGFVADKPAMGLGYGGRLGGAERKKAFERTPRPAAEPAPAPAPPSAPAVAETKPGGVQPYSDAAGRFEPPTEKFYSYRNNAPAAPKPAPPPQYFKPGEAAKAGVPTDERAAAGKEEERGEKRQAAADPKSGQAHGDPPQPQEEPQPKRKIIRTGEMEFEIENFDAAVAQVTKIAGEEQGFVGTVNSEKLPNGKVRGTVVVRCPPENLDRLLLKLRALGELKSQRIASQDVTKMYTDLEGRLRAARTMEERLIQIIKEGKGQIKDLLAAEKELGEWRTKIETLEGEIRYYNGMISLSTLTITLYEKEIRTPFGVVETEQVQMGLEVEDVDKAHKDALAAVADAKGRVTRSDLKQTGPGQLSAILNCEVPPDAAGPLRDRLKQLGTVARLDVQRNQRTEGGSGRATEVKVRREDTQFFISIYNLTTVAPRETVHLNLACVDAEKSYKDILARVEKAGGRVVTSSLQQPKKDQTTGTVHFEVKSADAEGVLLDLKTYGEVMRLQRTENPDAQNVTRSKQGFQCQVSAMGMVAPRETTSIQLVCKDVPAAYQAVLAAVQKAEGRILVSNLNKQDRTNVTGTIDFEVRREALKGVDEAVAGAGLVHSRSSTQLQDLENVVDSKIRLQLALVHLDRIPPLETTTINLACKDVPAAYQAILAAVQKAEAHILASNLNEQDRHNVTGTIDFEVRRDAKKGVDDAMAAAGPVYSRSSVQARDAQNAIDTKVRLSLTLLNIERIPPRETHTLAIEVGDVEAKMEAAAAAAAEAKGRTVDSTLTKDRDRVVARLVLDVPLASALGVVTRVKKLASEVRLQEASRNPQVPDSELAVARLVVTLSTESFVPSESSPWSSVRKGLSVSLLALSWAITLVIIGICAVGPVVLAVWGGWKLYRKYGAKAA